MGGSNGNQSEASLCLGKTVKIMKATNGFLPILLCIALFVNIVVNNELH